MLSVKLDLKVLIRILIPKDLIMHVAMKNTPKHEELSL